MQESSTSASVSPSLPLASLPGPGYHERCKALIIAMCYRNSIWKRERLICPIEDAGRIKTLLTGTYNFREEDIVMMTDEEKNACTELCPTRDNIMKAIDVLVTGATAGDSFVFYYAGHAAQQEAEEDQLEVDHLDECIYTADRKYVVDNDLRDQLVDRLPAGTRLTAIFDCCTSGTILDLNHDVCNERFDNRPRNIFPCVPSFLSAEAFVDRTKRWKVAAANVKKMVKATRTFKSVKEVKWPVRRCGAHCERMYMANSGPCVLSLSACVDGKSAYEDSNRKCGVMTQPGGDAVRPSAGLLGPIFSVADKAPV
ncbi:peptidase C14, caspase domain-containing protein [Amylostereum chailletii]|nr:peptidase C14, caspase domain-containing protein [Amylostereum chailletii]